MQIFKQIIFIILLIKISFFTHKVSSEPFVVLEYSSNSAKADESNSTFLNNEDFSQVHIIRKNETLSNIIEKYYGNGNLNLKFVQAAIVHKNKRVFVRANPNFMYAGKKLYLPSINEIKNLVYRNKVSEEKNSHKSSKKLDIYFFGN